MPTEGPEPRFGEMAVDVLDQLQAAGEGKQGGRGPEFAHDRLERLGGGGGGAELLDDLVGATEIGLGDDLGFAVDALADAGVVVGAAPDDLLDEAGHIFRSYNSVWIRPVSSELSVKTSLKDGIRVLEKT